MGDAAAQEPPAAVDADAGRESKRRRVDAADAGASASGAPPVVDAAAAIAPPSAVDAALAGVGGGTVVVHRLPRRWGTDELRALLRDGAGAGCASLRKQRGQPFGFVTFGFLADRLKAEAALPLHKPDGRPLTVQDSTKSKPKDAPRPARREGTAAAAASRAARDVRDAVCPLWQTPYAEQLQRKRSTVVAALQQLSRATKKASRGGAPFWARKAGAQACPLIGIVASPVRDGYRNKVDFTIGPDARGALAVGFNVGAFAEGFASVADPGECPHVSPAARAVAAWTQAHLRQHSALPAWDKRAGAGFWRLLLVREGCMAQRSGAGWRNWLVAADDATAADDVAAEGAVAGVTAPELPPPPAPWEGQPPPGDGAEVMCVMQIDATGRDAATVRSECAALAAALRAAAAAASPPLPLGPLLLQLHAGCSNVAPADAPLMPLDAYEESAGATAPSVGVLHERLFSLRFQISPDAFFQVNTAAAEALYELAGEWAQHGARDNAGGADAAAAAPAKATVLYDVCCGTGTIGLTLASRFTAVVGVDICEPAVQDAAANAALNGITNATFHAGPAECVLPQLLAQAAPGEVVAIVDPPRAGLHRSVLAALRQTPQLRRLVYISCNVESMAADAGELCAWAGSKGTPPFRPVRCAAVDLFPHTKHVEGVLLLERET